MRSLEDYVAILESSLIRLKETADNDVRQQILESVPLNGLFLSSALETAPLANQYEVAAIPSKSNRYPDGSNDRLGQSDENIIALFPADNQNAPKDHNAVETTSSKSFETLSRSPLILTSLSLFFKWLYPTLYFFIYREALLSAFFQEENSNAQFCSKDLIYAIAALGSRLSLKSGELYSRSRQYYELSRSAVLKNVFGTGRGSKQNYVPPSSKLVLIQSLLCLAFYDLGRAENASAWYLSGLAFRIVNEIGLHLNPAAFHSGDGRRLCQVDIEIRARIYWGCYLVDHFMADLFGRSCTLSLSNSTVPETDELPNVEAGLEDYMYYGPNKPLLVARPVRSLIILSRITELYKKRLTIDSKTTFEKVRVTDDFDRELRSWRLSLPEGLAWTNETLMHQETFDPTISYLWYHYYMVILNYNKKFLLESETSREVVEDTLEGLVYLLKSWQKQFKTFEKCSIQMIYTTILALQCMDTKNVSATHYTCFTSFLESSTLNYKLNTNTSESQHATESAYTVDLSNDVDNFLLNDNPDLTLLDEIDTLLHQIVHEN